ncbi:MAG: L-serine ammonia-lyase, iron-sulfur-dependent subunit beta [Lachnospiraceae bacterium]|nr:L-serine ammonia-lyase, iron-sulfur-dependent subunit beta [Lachnospiraceae bacterium]
MNLQDIIGPVMVGPSSSHTAGAARIGRVAFKLLGEPVAHADITLHGSFHTTGKGHGTDKAIVAGLMGFKVDDPRIPESFAAAKEAGLTYRFLHADLGAEVHPNTAKLALKGKSGKEMTVVAASVGGGRIHVTELDGLAVSFSGDLPTLVIHHMDQPGKIAEVATLLERKKINVASMRLYRARRGGNAVMVFECDQEVPASDVQWLSEQEATVRVIYLSQSRAGGAAVHV